MLGFGAACRAASTARSKRFQPSGSGEIGLSDLTDEEFKELSDLLDEPYRQYWARLGKFIHDFSTIEGLLQSLVHHYAGISDEVGKALFPGLRVDTAKDSIKRLLEMKGDSETLARLAPTFAQISVISGVRNDIVHYGARNTSAGLTVSNERAAHVPSKVRSQVVSARVLEDLDADLGVVMALLVRERFQEFSAFATAISEQVEPVAWRYKPPAQGPKKPPVPSGKGRQRPKRPPGSSQT
jgi:hypothetical protein